MDTQVKHVYVTQVYASTPNAILHFESGKDLGGDTVVVEAPCEGVTKRHYYGPGEWSSSERDARVRMTELLHKLLADCRDKASKLESALARGVTFRDPLPSDSRNFRPGRFETIKGELPKHSALVDPHTRRVRPVYLVHVTFDEVTIIVANAENTGNATKMREWIEYMGRGHSAKPDDRDWTHSREAAIACAQKRGRVLLDKQKSVVEKLEQEHTEGVPVRKPYS